ncbi:lipoprotein LpqH [Mycobacteroides chelonae]
MQCTGSVVVIGAGAIIALGLAGCSGDGNESAPSSAEKTTVSAEGGAAAMNSSAKVVVDGKEKKVEGAIACSTAAGQVNIGMGAGMQAIAVVLSDGDSPKVTSVGLGNIDGVTLGFADGAPGGKATATKDGKKYTVTGTATGVDTANPMQPIEKPFEIEVTCP